jgi:hypothetical protein
MGYLNCFRSQTNEEIEPLLGAQNGQEALEEDESVSRCIDKQYIDRQ